MTEKRATALIALLCFAVVPVASSAQVYSWKDASGKVHYGDRPPAERNAAARKLPAAPSATDDVEAARRAAAERQFAEREKQGKTEAEGGKAEDPAQARQREENCRRARSSVASLESGQARFTINDKGERVALDGAVREAELARARKSVDEWCKAPTAK